MRRKIFLAWIFTVMICGCSSSNISLELSYTPISIDSTDTISVSFNDCFDILSCIPLEETEDCHVASVRRVEFFEGNYYISSSNANVGLAVFDDKGGFVRRIGQRGNGHGEYVNLYDFAIDKKNRHILLLCNRSSLVKEYLLDGTFLKEKNIHATSLSSIACVDGLFLCPTNHQGFTRSESDSLFYVFDENLDFKRKHTYISRNDLGMSSMISASIRSYGNRFVYTDFHEHRTFILNKDGDVETCFEYKKDKMVPIDAFESAATFMEKQFDYDFIMDSAILENKCITLYKEGRSMKLSINRFDGECIINKPTSNLIPDFIGYEDDCILSVVSLESLKSLNCNVYDTYKGNACYFILKYKLKDKYKSA